MRSKAVRRGQTHTLTYSVSLKLLIIKTSSTPSALHNSATQCPPLHALSALLLACLHLSLFPNSCFLPRSSPSLMTRRQKATKALAVHKCTKLHSKLESRAHLYHMTTERAILCINQSMSLVPAKASHLCLILPVITAPLRHIPIIISHYLLYFNILWFPVNLIIGQNGQVHFNKSIPIISNIAATILLVCLLCKAMQLRAAVPLPLLPEQWRKTIINYMNMHVQECTGGWLALPMLPLLQHLPPPLLHPTAGGISELKSMLRNVLVCRCERAQVDHCLCRA